MYKAPIEIVTNTNYEIIKNVCNDIGKKIDGDIYRAVIKTGINVDKEELLKALNYDRDQYSKGYKDGYNHRKEMFMTMLHYLEEVIQKDILYMEEDEK